MGNPDAVNQHKRRPAATASGTRAPALRWRRAFPGDSAQIGALRRWLEWLLPPCPARDDLVSVAVELGTNAVRHTASGSGGQFAVEVTWSVQMARVAVYDGGAPDGPRVIEDPLGEAGRGLLMVNTLSVRRGVSGNAQGRVVWADILWAGPGGPGQPEFPGPPVAATGDDGGAATDRASGQRYLDRCPGMLTGLADPRGIQVRLFPGALTGNVRRMQIGHEKNKR
jgi:hypothetical protein